MTADVISSISTVCVWKNITRALFLFLPLVLVLSVSPERKGPGNNTLTPALSDSSWPRGSGLRLQVRSGRLEFPSLKAPPPYPPNHLLHPSLFISRFSPSFLSCYRSAPKGSRADKRKAYAHSHKGASLIRKHKYTEQGLKTHSHTHKETQSERA